MIARNVLIIPIEDQGGGAFPNKAIGEPQDEYIVAPQYSLGVYCGPSLDGRIGLGIGRLYQG